MSNSTTPNWLLDSDWGVGTDPYNWILYRRTGRTWRATSYYPTAFMLLLSFHEKLSRLDQLDSDLVEHIDAITRRVERSAAAFSDQLRAMGLELPPTALPTAENDVNDSGWN